MDGSNAQSLRGGFGNGSAYSDLLAAVGTEGTLEQRQFGGAVLDAKAENSIGKAVGAAKNALKSYNDQLEDLDVQIEEAERNGQDTIALENTKKSIQDKIAAIDNALSLEDIQDWQTSQEQLATLNAQDLNLEGMDYQEIVDEFFDSSNGMSEYLESFGSWSDQLQWMINNTTDETAKLKLQLEQGYSNLGEGLQSNIGNTIDAYGIDYSQFGVEDKSQYVQAASDQMLNQIKESGLTESEQLEFIASIDPDASLAEIQYQIDNINTSGSLPKLAFEPTLTDRSDFSEDDISDILEETDTKATFFIIGWVAKRYPDIVRRIAEKYEIGSHTMNHQLVWQQSPTVFKEDIESSIKLLEDITGRKVLYFRAPGFSIRRQEAWAFEILHDMGIVADCSVFLYFFKSIGKPIAVYIFQAKKYNRIFIHPFLAQLFFGRHPEPRKKIAAVLCDVEELRQHGQEECLAKTPRTGKKRDTRQTAGKKLVQEACLVNIIVLFPTDLGKTFPSDQDLHLGHRVSSLS